MVLGNIAITRSRILAELVGKNTFSDGVVIKWSYKRHLGGITSEPVYWTRLVVIRVEVIQLYERENVESKESKEVCTVIGYYCIL